MATPNYNIFRQYASPNTPVHVAHTVFSGQVESMEHTHDYYEFFFVRNGTLIHRINGRIFEMKTNSIYFIYPNDVHSFNNHPEYESVVITNISFPEVLFQQLCSQLPINPFKEWVLKNPWLTDISPECWNNIVSRTDLLLSNVQMPSYPEKCLIFNSLFLSVAVEYAKAASIQNNAIPYWLMSAYMEMQRRDNYIAGLPRFIELSGKSQEHLTRELKKYYKVQPTKYVNDLRLQEAAARLIDTSLPIAQLCFDVGFENLSYFINLFTRKYGISPNKYRKQKVDMFYVQ